MAVYYMLSGIFPTLLMVALYYKGTPRTHFRDRVLQLFVRVLGNGQIGVIDESFEKEVWYVGRTPALFLTLDVWHPDLSGKRRRQLGSP